MRAGVTLGVFLVVLGAVAPAGAATVNRLPDAGPAFASGGSLVWGEERAGKRLAVVRRTPGERPRDVRRIGPARGENEQHYFGGVPGGVTASERWVGYALDKATTTSSGDFVIETSGVRAFGSRDGGPFRDLVPQCRGAAYSSLSADGDGILIGQAEGECGGREATRVWLVEGDAPPRLIHETAEEYVGLRQVQLAGPYLAWSEGGQGAGDKRITVADRATGAVIARYTTADFAGGHGFAAFDLDAAGNLVALSGPQPRCYYVCVTVRNVRTAGKRTITRRALDSSVAIAGGRIAYVSQRRERGHRVVVARLDGTVVRRFDRLGRRRRAISELALTPDRIAWAVVRWSGDAVFGAPGSIRTARLP